MVLLAELVLMFEQIEEKTVIMMHPCGQLLHPEQRMHGNYFKGYPQYVLLFDDMGDDRFPLLDKFDQSLQ
jgi:hypothetical protein